MAGKVKLTKAQHLVALLIVIPGIPLALPLSLLATAFRWAGEGFEALYDLAGTPFLWARHKWLIRCERVNAALSQQTGSDNE